MISILVMRCVGIGWDVSQVVLCQYGLLWLLPTSGENVIPTAHLETYLLGKMVTCSILILPAVYIHVQGSVYNHFTKY